MLAFAIPHPRRPRRGEGRGVAAPHHVQQKRSQVHGARACRVTFLLQTLPTGLPSRWTRLWGSR